MQPFFFTAGSTKEPAYPGGSILVMLLTVFLSMVMIMVVVMIVIMVVMPLTILRHIHLVVPAILHEIHWTAAGVVVAAIGFPLLRLPRRYMQVHRFVHDTYWTMDDDRLGINYLRPGEIADVELPVEAGLTDRNRYPYIRTDC